MPFDEADSGEVERLLVAARADGLAGEASRQIGWFERVSRDGQWDAGLVLLARDDVTGALAAVAHSWTSGFLKDLAVDERHRRRGLGQALVGETAGLFCDRGLSHLDLKVRPANIPARRFYRSLGFRTVDG